MSDLYFVVECPHCQCSVLIFQNEINCAIFRHGVYRHSLEQINPHLPKDECEELVKDSAILGCGKPFKLHKNGDKWKALVCGYM